MTVVVLVVIALRRLVLHRGQHQRNDALGDRRVAIRQEMQLSGPFILAGTDIAGRLAPFDLKNQLSSNRTQGVPNMIALVREHAARIAAG